MTLEFNRRDLFRLGAAGFCGMATAPWFQVLAADAASSKAKKNCILIWCIGGPPQTLTWDVKSHSPVKAIKTAAPGVQIAEMFTRTAAVMKDVTLLRGMQTADSNHNTARYLMHTGFRKGMNGVPHPVLGSVLAKELGNPNNELPNFVSVGSPKYGGFGPGHLGPKFAPIRVDNVTGGLDDLKPADGLKEFDDRAALLNDFNKGFLEKYPGDAAAAHQVTLEQAKKLMHSPKTKAFDISSESTKTRELYGSSRLGDSAILARRLIENGVRFVEIRQDNWDVHKDTVSRTKKNASELDPAFAGLIADLKQRGLLDDTLVICMGEFGRNPANGSNHFSRAWTTVLAGGGLKHGQAIGNTGSSGGTVESKPISAGDFMATVGKALGIDVTAEWEIATGRPIPKVAKGSEPVKELFAS
jgi:uncharacterized protein (DUF1501 family)